MQEIPEEIQSSQNIQGIYVLGDNRRFSTDSRHFGLIDSTQVIGKARYIFGVFTQDWARLKERAGTTLDAN